MNQEYTPDASSGQGETGYSPGQQGNSGQGYATPDDVGGQGYGEEGAQQQVDYSDLQKSYHEMRAYSTRQEQELAELKRQQETYLRAQEQQKQALAQALGIAPQEQSVDPMNALLEDPYAVIEARANQLLEQRINPIEQKLQAAEMKEYFQEQSIVRQQLEQEYSQWMDASLMNRVLDVTGLLGDMSHIPENQRDQVIYQALQNAGGYQALVQRNLGRILGDNPSSFMRSAGQFYNQKQMQAKRASSIGGYQGGASVNQSGGSPYRTSSVYR